MIVVGLIFIFLAIRFDYEPLLLIPIGTGIIIGNIPFFQAEGINLQIGIYQSGSVLNYLYFGILKGIYPPLIFLGIGAMTDFSSLISNPRLMLLGAAAQVGIFLTFLSALFLGFNLPEAASIGIIGGADGPTAIFLSSKLANGEIINGIQTQNLIGPNAIAAYSYMALVPVIQPPIMRLLTSKRERKIRMKPPRSVSKFEKIMNLFLSKDKKINSLVGAAGVSAVPDSARVVQNNGLKADPNNHLLMHAMAPNVAGVIGSAVAAGILISFLL